MVTMEVHTNTTRILEANRKSEEVYGLARKEAKL